MKYLGIDWATTEHVAALVDEDGAQLALWHVTDAWAAVSALLEQLDDEGGPAAVLVGIEPGAKRVTGALLAAGYTVYEINPKQADRFRDRFSPAGAKDDRRDALVLANAVRTDRQWLRPTVAVSELDEELALRCRDRQGLVDHRRRLMQQLTQTLRESYPAVLDLGIKLSRRFVLELLLAYPDPRRAQRAQRRRLGALLRRHRIRKLDVEELKALLGAETFPVSAAARRAYADKTRWLARAIEGLNVSIAECEATIATVFAAHPDRDILESVPGVGAHLAPYLAAAIATTVGAAPAPATLQAIAGTAPCTRRSGKQTRGHVSMRRHCHSGLQAALYNVARCSRAGSTWARAYYDHQRARGVRHNSAVRALSNKWAKIIATLLSRRETYDESRHLSDLRRASVSWAPPRQGEAA